MNVHDETLQCVSHQINTRYDASRAGRYTRVMEDYSRDAIANRLKEARAAKFATAADAARAIGKKEVTVRAHESGQNGLSASMARTYAKAYGVSAEWLLYGKGQVDIVDHMLGVQAELSRRNPGRIPVLGEVRPRALVLDEPSDPEPIGFLAIQVSGYELIPLAAYQIGRSSPGLGPDAGRYLIVAPVHKVGLRDRDLAVMKRRHNAAHEIFLSVAQIDDDGPYLSGPVDDKVMTRLTPEALEGEALTIEGVVVANYSIRDRSGLPIDVPEAAVPGTNFRRYR